MKNKLLHCFVQALSEPHLWYAALSDVVWEPLLDQMGVRVGSARQGNVSLCFWFGDCKMRAWVPSVLTGKT